MTKVILDAPEEMLQELLDRGATLYKESIGILTIKRKILINLWKERKKYTLSDIRRISASDNKELQKLLSLKEREVRRVMQEYRKTLSKHDNKVIRT